MEMEGSEVSEWYEGVSVFVTGGTGFMGKVLLEKLLYSCPRIGTVFMLMRPKRGKSIETRVHDITNIPLFKRIREECPERLRKLVAVGGDVGEADLGMTPADRARLIAEVQVVFHGAATLRLDSKLKDSVNMNTEGTLRVINLAKQMPKLKVLVHVSTAFCHVDQVVLEEKTYPPPADPDDIVQLCHWIDDDILEEVTPRILSPHPNAYTYSKRLAEAVIEKHHPELPCVIVRPSIVTPSWVHPMKGWVDNLNGPIGLLVGGAKGVIRSMHCNGELKAEVIPVDMAINSIITIAWKIGSQTERSSEVPVFNLSQNVTKPVTWNEVVEKGKSCAVEYPFEMMLWYPGGEARSNKFVHDLYVLFTHWVPAYIIDFLMIIFGQKPFMLKIQRRIQDGLNVLQYFTTRDWKFPNRRLIAIRESLNQIDREVFTLDFEKIDIMDYLKHCFLGARHFLMKEDPNSLTKCRRNLRFFWLLDKSATVCFYLLLVWMVVSWSSSARSLLDSLLSVFSAFPFMRTVKI